VITIGQLLPLLDSIAAGVGVHEAAYGVGQAGTISGAADANANTLAAIDDMTVQRDLTGPFALRAQLVRAAAVYRALAGPMLSRSIDRHIGGTFGSLSTFLRTNNARVDERLTLIGFVLDADLVFMATSIVLASWTGAGFVDGGAIDVNQRADAATEVLVQAKGATPGVLHVTLANRTGAVVVADVAIGAGVPVNTTIAILGGQRFADVTDVAYTGGDAADRFAVRTIVERNVAL
jgi:hypothetical protein